MLRNIFINKSPLEKSLYYGLGTMLLLLSFSAFLVLFSFAKFQTTSNWVSQTNNILLQLERVLDEMLKIESSARGYALSGREVYLEKFNNAENEFNESVKHLERLIEKDRRRKKDCEKLKMISAKRISFSKQLIDKRMNFGIEAAIIYKQSDSGQYYMDKFREQTIRFEEEENNELKLREANYYKWQFWVQTAFFVLVTLISITLLISYQIIKTNFKRRIEAERQLKNEKKLLQNIIDNTSTLIYIKEPTGKFLLMNKRYGEVYGIPSAQMIGKKDSDFFDEETIEQFREADMKVFTTGEVVEAEEEAVMQGSKRTYLSIKFPLYDSGGSIYAICGMSTDITDRKGYEAQILSLNKRLENNVFKLNNINRELEAFTYTVSHDLRAPLRAINGFASLLINKNTEKNFDDETLRIIQIMRENSQQMGQLIDDLLAFSKVGRYKPNLQKTNMQEVVDAVVKQIGQIADLSKVAISVQKLESAVCDPNLIKQVWTNLVSNAFKYSSQKSKQQIEIGCFLRGAEIVYFIKDNGAGFDMKYYNKLFGIFQRLHSNIEFEGTGVGLAIVNRIVKRHSGKVWAESVVGEGATFYFSLPIEPKFIEV
jgi:PAS domain S-box-containing protein